MAETDEHTNEPIVKDELPDELAVSSGEFEVSSGPPAEVEPFVEVIEGPPREQRQALFRAQEEDAAATKKARMNGIFDRWKDGFRDQDDGPTAEELRNGFFADVTDQEIEVMCMRDPDNPLALMDHVIQLQGSGVLPSLPSFGQVIREFTSNRPTIVAEICRNVRRGRIV